MAVKKPNLNYDGANKFKEWSFSAFIFTFEHLITGMIAC